MKREITIISSFGFIFLSFIYFDALACGFCWPGPRSNKKVEAASEKPISMSPIKQCAFDVEGMTCSACEAQFKEKFKNTAGIKDVEASYKKGTVKIKYDENLISKVEIEEALSELPFKIKKSALEK